jgi:hypothetical protein
VDRSTINSLSIELGKLKSECRNEKPGINIDALMSYFSGLRDAKEGFDFEALYTDLLSGNIVFLIDGCEKYLAVNKIHNGSVFNADCAKNKGRQQRYHFQVSTMENEIQACRYQRD